MQVLEPAGSRIVTKTIEKPNAAGLTMPPSAKERPQTSEIIAVGPEVIGGFKVGDIVCHTRFAVNEVELEDTTVMIIKEEDILATVKQTKEKK